MSQNQFLFELSKMFESGRQTNQTVRITMKRYDGRTGRNPRKPQDKPRKKRQPTKEETPPAKPTEYKCLIRACIGSKKIRIEIGRDDVEFQQSYSNLIKGNVYGLKRKQ